MVVDVFNPRQREADLWVQDQADLQSEFYDSQGYTEKPCWCVCVGGQDKKKPTRIIVYESSGIVKNCRSLVWKLDQSMDYNLDWKWGKKKEYSRTAYI